MPYRIFVVDDDPSILDLMRVLLESEGYSVETFEAAPQALKAATKAPPDAAIVDLMMPEMTGLDLLRAFRYNARTRALPVLICSAYYENLSMALADFQQEGVWRLRKPFHVVEMLDIIRQMVKKSRRRASRAEAGGSPGPGRVSAFAASHQ